MEEGVALLWPERWSFYRLMEQYEDDPISFNSELQNEPVNPRDCLFNVSEFTYWDDQYVSKEALLRALGEDAEFYGACDPSLGQDTMRGDFTAIIILARDRRTRSMYVVEADLQRSSPTQTIEAIFAYYQRYRVERFAIETNQFQELLAQEVERRGRELGQYPPIERVKHTTEAKVRRIQSLHPWLKNGAVQMCRKHTLLLEQCRFFPKGKHDVGPDALEMAVRAAEQGACTPMLHVINLNGPERNADDEDGDARWINLD
jgi:predicted phage terminase large subunit-like protein